MSHASNNNSTRRPSSRYPHVLLLSNMAQSEYSEHEHGYVRSAVGNIFSCLIALTWSVSGLILTLYGLYRGDQQLFIAAFALMTGVNCAYLLLNLIGLIAVCKKCCDCCSACSKFAIIKALIFAISRFLVAIIIMIVFNILACAACLGLIIAALVSGSGLPHRPDIGCNDFGCANVIGILAAIGSGLSILVHAGCACCIIMASHG